MRKISGSGRHIASVPVKNGEHIKEIDPLATCLASAIRRAQGKTDSSETGVMEQDIRSRIRVQPVRKTIIFLIDSSESMLVEEQMKIAKSAVLGLLTQAYQKRYRVGVIVFSDTRARVALPPTTSITRARRALQAVRTGGGTPLADGLHKALHMVRSEKIRHPNDMPQVILVTDGRPSIKMDLKADIREEVLSLARMFPQKAVPAIVLSTAEPGGIIREIAAAMKAPLRKLSDVIHS